MRLLFVRIILLANISTAQNLIKNGSFEIMKSGTSSSAAPRLQPRGAYCFASGKKFLNNTRYVGKSNFKSEILNFKMLEAGAYSQL
jgi:hypothetical protein